MSNIYDNWDRLVGAVIRREELWKMFHDQSPSVSSESSDFSLLDFEILDVPFDFSSHGGSSPNHQLPASEFENLRMKKKTGLVFVQGFSPNFDLGDMLKSTAQFLGEGTFGSSYMAAMDNGITVVLKRLNAVNISEKKFRQQMEVIGSVRHENVCALKAYYFSKDEKLMVYDHYSNGSVSAILHGKTGKNRAPLDWETRLRIVIGAARGISHIHKQSGGKLVHGNIKLSNIFLNSQQYGCVSDLGLARMIKSRVTKIFGYHAPEVNNNQNVSQASDVYSFGVLLLQLLAGKSPSHATGVNLSKQMAKMMEIGISCLAKTPTKRPKMGQVVKMMEDITMIYAKNDLQPKLEFIEGRNPDFDFEYMLRASAEVLGRGTFGTSYKGTLENGITIAVKKLRNVIVTFEEFQEQMEVIGRIRNQSVATIMAYYYSRDEKLMVYDYYDAGSVSSMLHGKLSKRKSLDWKTRLRIAVGAARGIAHIHEQLGQNPVHGNVKTSNIFVNAQGYGCVSEVGLAKLMNTKSVLHRQSSGYRAPEVTDTKKLSQASDIYSFGVVLLELLTGKPAMLSDYNKKATRLVSWVPLVAREDWIVKVLDLELWEHQNMGEEVGKVFQIALDCVKSVPNHRPKMSDVTRMLEDVYGTNFGA